MKGTVVNIWIQTLTNLYGESSILKAMNNVNWDSNRIISPMEDIEDLEIFGLIEEVAELQNKEKSEVWRLIGQNNIETFSKWFPSYFEHSNYKGFMMMMDTVHKQLTKMIRGANPPRLIPSESEGNSLVILYKSKRGMFDYLVGLMEGGAKYFNEHVEMEELERGQDSDGMHYMKMKMTFEYSTSMRKKFGLSMFFSLGVIKSIPMKIAIPVTLISTIVIYLTTPFNLTFLGIEAATILLSTYIISSMIIAPNKYIS